MQGLERLPQNQRHGQRAVVRYSPLETCRLNNRAPYGCVDVCGRTENSIAPVFIGYDS